MDYNSMPVSEMETILLRTKKRLVKSMNMVDKTLAILMSANGQNGLRKPVKIHSISRARKPKAKAASKSRVLQGRYLGAVRWLNKSQRADVKKVKDEKGYTAAISKAKQLQA